MSPNFCIVIAMIEPSLPNTQNNDNIQRSRWNLPDGYEVRRVDRFEEPEYKGLVKQILYGEHPTVDWANFMSESEIETQAKLRKDFGRANPVRLGAYKEGKLVGFCFGFQDCDSSFSMAASGVLPEHRRKGLYRFLAERMLEISKGMDFPQVSSRHVATNNAVLIAKLKLGFVVTGMELSETFGTLLQLTYFHHPLRRKVFHVRAGLARPDEQAKSVLGF